MNFSQMLVPLPVLPHSEESDRDVRPLPGDFVSEQDVARVLLGTTGHLPVEGLPAEDFGFAGRADLRVPASAFVPVVEAAGPPPPPRIHPAFAPLIEEGRRRAAPPQAIEVPDLEAAYGVSRGRASDLWWMMGVAVALAALLVSGILFDFSASREISTGPATVPPAVPSAVPVDEEASPAPSLVSARPAGEIR